MTTPGTARPRAPGDTVLGGQVPSGVPGAVTDAVALARSVFIVDDDPTTRLHVDACLAAIGLANPRFGFGCGATAIADLTRRAALGPVALPALILLDLQMPGLSGLDVLRWMRDTPTVCDVAVVMLSGVEAASEVNEAYRLGVRSYLVKPVGFEALGPVVKDLGLAWLLA